MRFLFCLMMVLASSAYSSASFVMLDDFLPGGGALGTPTVSSSGLATSAYGGGNLLVNFTGAGSISLSYTGFAPILPGPVTSGGSIDLFNVSKAGTGIFARLFVNGSLIGQSSFASGSVLSFDVLNALGAVTYTSMQLDIFKTTAGVGNASFSQLVATPEPTSMLTAGAFSLFGGWMYRRRRKLAKA